MKKLSLLVVSIVAIASLGGMIGSAHAQTAPASSLTPDQVAALQQELSSLEAQLQALQTQAAAESASQPSAPAGTMSSPAASGVSLSLGSSGSAALSSADAASLDQALTLLASVLQNIQFQYAANPSVAAADQTQVTATLESIASSLAGIGASVTGGASAPVAMTAPSAPSAPSGATVMPQSPTAESAPSALTPSQGTANGPSPEGALPAPSANGTPAVAEAGSVFPLSNLNWPLIGVIVLILAVIAMWLFWPGEAEEPVQVARQTASAKQSPMIAKPAPIVAATAAPAQKPAMPVPPQGQQQRRPA